MSAEPEKPDNLPDLPILFSFGLSSFSAISILCGAFASKYFLTGEIGFIAGQEHVALLALSVGAFSLVVWISTKLLCEIVWQR